MSTMARLIPVLCPALLAACSPALRRTETFTPQRVMEVQFEDRCRLQSHFDLHEEPLAVVSEQSMAGAEASAGKITYRLPVGPDRAAFLRLLGEYYRRVPALDDRAPLLVTVLFVHKLDRSGAAQHMPIGAETEVIAGRDSFQLPYHPCLGAFFFGRPYYAMRRQVLKGTEALAGR
jgi:hypothetical protein